MKSFNFSYTRLEAILLKEFIHLKRDRVSLILFLFIPLLQLMLFGFVINTDPKELPTAIVALDSSPQTRHLVKSLENTGYFHITHYTQKAEEAESLLFSGKVQFVVHLSENFSRKLFRQEKPVLLVQVDATDPVTAGPAISALEQLNQSALTPDFQGPLSYLQNTPPPFEIRIHKHYNPEGFSHYNIIPGLIGTLLTMNLVMITSIAITREKVKGTFETLLATPVCPTEVLLGKLITYLMIAYVQVMVILATATLVFKIPIQGSLGLLLICTLIFAIANLAIGITFSTLAKTELQASQMPLLFFLPSLLLSGSIFPFRGMPFWAQWLAQCLPLTHFLKIVRGILLKGNGWQEIAEPLLYIFVFMLLALGLAIKRYQRTLD